MKHINFTKIIFQTIDKVFEWPQNPHFIEKKLEDVQCIDNIHYSNEWSETDLDLYFMPHEDKRPVIFEIHGGGFSAGDKKYRRCLCKYLSKNTGAIVVNVNYGVGAERPCPVPMQQLADAVNWVADNAEKYNMDLSRFVATGDSAGAYYACFLAALQDSEYLQSVYDRKLNAKFTATVLNCGIYDFNLALKNKSPINNGVCHELTGMEIEQAVNSPIFPALTLTTHITEKFPETLLIYAHSDVFCKGQGEELLNVFQEKNVPVRCVCSKSVVDNHTYSLIWVTSMAKQTNETIIAFLNEHFGNLHTTE